MPVRAEPHSEERCTNPGGSGDVSCGGEGGGAGRPRPEGRGSSLLRCLDLDEITAGVVEDRYGYPVNNFRRFQRELYTLRFQPIILCTDVFDTKRRGRDILFEYPFLVCLCNRIAVRLEQEFGPVPVIGETTVSHLYSPAETSLFFTKPSVPV